MINISLTALPIFVMQKRRRASMAWDGDTGGRGRPLSFGSAWGLVLDAIVTIYMPVGCIIIKRRWAL